MGFITIFDSVQVVEGLTAIVFYPLFHLIIRDIFGMNKYYVLVIGWMITWLLRKIATNIYKAYLKSNDMKPTEYKVNIPLKN